MNSTFLHLVRSLGVLFGGLLFLVSIALLVPIGQTAARAGGACAVPVDYATIQAAVDDPGCASIVVQAGVYNENIAITRSLTLEGSGWMHTILDGMATDSVISVTVDTITPTVTLSNIGLRNGDASLGGGIYNEGFLTVTNSHIYDNHAETGGGIVNFFGATLVLSESDIYSNTADTAGALISVGQTAINESNVYSNTALTVAGLFNGDQMTADSVNLYANHGHLVGALANTGEMTLDNSQVYSNVATFSGGGIFNQGTNTPPQVGILQVSNSSISGNQAGIGAGVVVLGALTMTNSTISHNEALTDGAGIYYGSLMVTPSLILDNVELFENSAAALGGGLFFTETLPSTPPPPTRVFNSLVSDDSGSPNRALLELPERLVGRQQANSSVKMGSGSTDINIVNSNIHDNTSADFGGGLYNYNREMTLNNVEIYSNQAITTVGGIYNAISGTITLIDSDLYDNSAILFGATYNQGTMTIEASRLYQNTGAVGVGLANEAGAQMMIANSRIYSNTAQANALFATPYGAGVASAGQLTLDESEVSGNTASYAGGGAANVGGRMTVINSTVSHNNAGIGGGILTLSAPLTLTNSTISSNEALTDGGGIYFVSNFTATLNNVTVANNQAAGIGGGVFISGTLSPPLFFASQSNLSLLEAGLGLPSHHVEGTTRGLSDPIYIKNSLIGDNTAASGADCFGSLTSEDYNLIENIAGCVIGGTTTNNLTGDAILGPLQNNGGATETHALLAGSQAIDAGTNSGCPPTDQRGVVRPVDGDGDLTATCDIGAYEFEPVIPSISIDDISITEGDSGPTAFMFTIELSEQTSLPVMVDYQTMNGSATAATDYVAASGTLTFMPNTSTQPLTITVFGDTSIEADETFFIDLSNPVNATLADAQGQGTILDDDGATPTPTATNTVTPSPSPTASNTETPGPSPTASNTPTAGPSPTASNTPTAGPSPTASNTPTAGPSPTATSTPTAGMTNLYLPIIQKQ